MKNEYQEALDNFWLAINCNAIPYDDVMGKDLKTIQELVDKETPKKVVKWDNAEPATRCPVCGRGVIKDGDDEYCPNCGQKLDWSEINDNN